MVMVSSGVIELTRQHAERVVKDLVQAGEVRRKQASVVVKDLMEISRANRGEFMRVIGAEVRTQIENLGLATKQDVERLERRIARLEAGAAESRAQKTPGRSKSTAGKTTARKSTARKTTRQKPTSAGSSSV